MKVKAPTTSDRIEPTTGATRADFAEVWQDVVSKRHLAISVTLGIVLEIISYLSGLWLVQAINPSIKPDLLRGYALFFGVAGCLLAAGIACYRFKPKRIISEATAEAGQFLEALREQNIAVKDELAALKSLPPEIKRELEDVEVYDRLVEILEEDQRHTATNGGGKWK